MVAVQKRSGYVAYGRVLLLGSLVAVIFAACAKGSTSDKPSGPTGPAASIPPGKIGGICGDQVYCEEGTCTLIGESKFCAAPCPPSCPKATYCALINGEPICVPDLGSQCLPCETSAACKNPSDACLTAALGDKFCARDCSTTGECPNGFSCKATGEPAPGKPYKFCAPNGALSCPCKKARDGVKRTCKVENESGVCLGTETCIGDTGKWEGCTAKTPEPEVCNTKDENCSGT